MSDYTNKKVYIILVNYNGWQDTIECLESLYKIDYENYQVLVVDNDSSNNSLEYIKSWADGKTIIDEKDTTIYKKYVLPYIEKPKEYIEYNYLQALQGGDIELEKKYQNPLILIKSNKNGGFSYGNNIAIKYALKKNDFDSVILLNNDTVIGKDTISEIVKARMNFAENAIYGGRIFYYNDQDLIWYDGGHFNEWIGRATHINMKKKLHEIKNNDINTVNFITFCYVLIPKFILNKVGLLDESYFMYVEDLDYSYKVWKSGYKLYHIPTSKVWHKVGASSGKDEVSEFSAYWMMRNNIRIRKKIKNKIKFFTSFLFFYLSRIYTLSKWAILRPKIVKSLLVGIKDGIYS